MRIAIVGPTHPYKGGIAQHTTALAHRLSQAGNEVSLLSWKTQYPFFYPGQQFVPEDKPELEPFAGSQRILSWKNPSGWWRLGKKLRQFDRVILVWWVPTIQGPVYRTILKALGKESHKATIVCHNVMTHEPKPAERVLVRSVFNKVGHIITHSTQQAKIAKGLSSTRVYNLHLPFTLQGEQKKNSKLPYSLKHKLLFFGLVRPYKGLDVLLKALAQTSDKIKLQVSGELWGSPKIYQKLIDALNLEDRVTINPMYVPSEDIDELFQSADALVLPYKRGTASWNVSLAHSHGLPVIATATGSLVDNIKDNVDGLICQPDDVKSLAEAINHFYEPGVAKRLYKGLTEPSAEEDWQRYIEVVIKG